MRYGTEKRTSRLFAPGPLPEYSEKPICRRSERCKGCPHASHGFICWHKDGACLRTDMERINNKESERL